MRQRGRLFSGAVATWMCIMASVAVSTLALAADASAARPQTCPLEITSCGCVISKAGTYTVANDLHANQTTYPNCIEITASYSILNLKGFAVLGNGRGIGILIEGSASHVVVAGGDEGATPAPPDAGMNGQDFPSAQAVVTGWDIGIQDEGDYAVIALFKNVGGSIFQPDQGNTTAGILVSGARNSTVGDLHASHNGKAGVILRGSSGIRLFNFSAIGNGESGVWLDHADDNVISTGSAAGNGKYGMWLLGSSRNLILNSNGTSGNGDTGILLGCGSGTCTGSRRSDQNRITNSGAPGNTSAGIVIEKYSGNNIVSITHNDGNPQNRDMVDENNKCDRNTWYNNTGSGNQSCVR